MYNHKLNRLGKQRKNNCKWTRIYGINYYKELLNEEVADENSEKKGWKWNCNTRTYNTWCNKNNDENTQWEVTSKVGIHGKLIRNGGEALM